MHHLLSMEIDQAFCHFDQLFGSLSEYEEGVEYWTYQTRTVDVALEMGRPRKLFEGTIAHPWRDETIMFQGCGPGPDEREDIRMIKLSPYEGLPTYPLHHQLR
jgi:hypothetical protein